MSVYTQKITLRIAVIAPALSRALYKRFNPEGTHYVKKSTITAVRTLSITKDVSRMVIAIDPQAINNVETGFVFPSVIWQGMKNNLQLMGITAANIHLMAGLDEANRCDLMYARTLHDAFTAEGEDQLWPQ